MPRHTQVRGDGNCSDGDTCPSAHWTDRGTIITVGKQVTDPADLADLAIAADEVPNELPGDFFPEARPLITDPAELSAFLRRATFELARVEALPFYDVGTDGGDYERYVRGQDGPDAARKAAWHKVLQSRLDSGIRTRRVHIVRAPLSDYLRFEFEWGYRPNAGYEDIRILDVAEAGALASLARVGDFWVVDGTAAAVMAYDEAGRYLGFREATAGTLPLYAAVMDAAWDAGEPFGAWWDTHREYWRGNRQAA